MGGFAFRLEHQDGTPAEPRTFEAAVPNWRTRGHDPARTGSKPAGRRDRRDERGRTVRTDREDVSR
jgi:hypothetical protein